MFLSEDLLRFLFERELWRRRAARERAIAEQRGEVSVVRPKPGAAPQADAEQSPEDEQKAERRRAI